MASSSPNPSSSEFRILLDQGFPKPTHFVIGALDRSVTITHLSDFAPALSVASTPDWFVYCAAAEAGFGALVVRDRSQLEQLAEMYVLSRLRHLTIVTWRKGIDDPVREWGQLLAYLPDIKKRCGEGGGRAILLPSPNLTKDSFHVPTATLGTTARQRSISTQQALDEARSEISDWLAMAGQPEDRFADLLGHQ